jgi:hypothetical protein
MEVKHEPIFKAGAAFRASVSGGHRQRPGGSTFASFRERWLLRVAREDRVGEGMSGSSSIAASDGVRKKWRNK